MCNSSMTRITFIRMIFSKATLQNLEVYQIDMETSFLNGDFDEKTLHGKTKSLFAYEPGNKVCTLVKSLYVIKQTSKHVASKNCDVMLERGFRPTMNVTNVFM